MPLEMYLTILQAVGAVGVLVDSLKVGLEDLEVGLAVGLVVGQAEGLVVELVKHLACSSAVKPTLMREPHAAPERIGVPDLQHPN